jgi:hypothetical protein
LEGFLDGDFADIVDGSLESDCEGVVNGIFGGSLDVDM